MKKLLIILTVLFAGFCFGQNGTHYIVSTYETTGLSVTLDIYDLSDNSAVMSDTAMSEVSATGVYKFNFTTYDSTKNYLYISDAGSGQGDNRYRYAINNRFIDASIAATTTLGRGNTEQTYTVNDADGNPLSGVSVDVRTANDASQTPIAEGTTDDNGQVTFYLDSSVTYYLWRQKAGYTFSNPDTEVVE